MAGRRPSQIKPPTYLTKSPPVPQPAEIKPQEEHGGPKGLEPTRYGDWDSEGRCWDF